MKNRRRRKTSRAEEGRKTMTPTAEEKRKSIHTRKTREFSRMRIAYLRQTGFNGKIAFLYVRVPTHFVYFCVLCVLARARAFFKKVLLFAWKSFHFFFSHQFSSNVKRTRNWHLANFHLMTSFFFWWAPREDDELGTVFFFCATYVYGCMHVVVRKMDDGRLASVVVYNFISIYYHLHLNL